MGKRYKTIDFKIHLKKSLKNPEYKKEFDALEKEFKLASDLIRLRIKANLTQKQLAKKVGTSQPAIARIESGSYTNFTMSFLKRLGKVLKVEPILSFKKL